MGPGATPTNDVPHAVAALGRVIGSSGEELARDYGDVFRFWLARLAPLDRVVADARGALLRKGGRDHLVLGAQSMPIVAADEPFEAVRVDHALAAGVEPVDQRLAALELELRASPSGKVSSTCATHYTTNPALRKPPIRCSRSSGRSSRSSFNGSDM